MPKVIHPLPGYFRIELSARWSGSFEKTTDQMVAVFKAVLGAHEFITGVRIGWGDHPVEVDVIVPRNVELDLAELTDLLTARVAAALEAL